MGEKTYRNLIFDLDGTVADSRPGMLDSLRHTFTRIGRTDVELSVYEKFMGPLLNLSFKKYLGLDDDQTALAIGIYRDHYAHQGIFNCTAYPGIPDLIAELAAGGLRLFVASSKLEKYAVLVVRRLGMARYFEQVRGSNPDNTLTAKADIIRLIMDGPRAPSTGETLMVGDMDLDVRGARANGLDVLAVLYGYGDRDDILASCPDYTAASVDELKSILGTITTPRS